MPAMTRGPASTAARCAWSATPATSTSPPRGTPGLPPPQPCGYSPRWGTQSLHRHALGLANRFRAGIGLEPGDSAIVSLATNGAAADAMTAARITGSARAGRLRLSFHVSTSDQDADLAADVLRRHVTSRHPATL